MGTDAASACLGRSMNIHVGIFPHSSDLNEATGWFRNGVMQNPSEYCTYQIQFCELEYPIVIGINILSFGCRVADVKRWSIAKTI